MNKDDARDPFTYLALANTAPHYLSAQGPNVLRFSVGDSPGCREFGYPNEPCTEITLCLPGTRQCEKITDLLVDTGSVGVRIFRSALHLPWSPLKENTQLTYAQCAQFGTGSTWGPLTTLDVQLGGEPPVTLPIQIIDAQFSGKPSLCYQSDENLIQSGYQGILGIGHFKEDCGEFCEKDPKNQIYFQCDEQKCDSTQISKTIQLQNPIAHLPTDSNGVILALPEIGASGESSVQGVLIFGIGTSNNNQPVGVQAYPTDSAGNFSVTLENQIISDSFIDSGSNGLFFPNLLNLPLCGDPGLLFDFYCPTTLVQPLAYNHAYGSSNRALVPLSISHAGVLFSSENYAFNNLGGTGTLGFDWGLPFFYGRAVFIGLEAQDSPLGRGPYVAY